MASTETSIATSMSSPLTTPPEYVWDPALGALIRFQSSDLGIDDLRAANTRLQDKVVELELEKVTLKKGYEQESDKLRAEMASLKFQKKELESYHTKLRKVTQSLEDKIEMNKASFESQLRKMREDANFELAEANSQHDEAEKRIENLNTKLTMWSQAYEALKVTKKESDDQLKSLQAGASSESQAASVRHNKAISELKDLTARLEEDNTKWAQRCKSLDEIKNNLEHRLISASKDRDIRVEKMEEKFDARIQRERAQWESSVDALESENEHLKSCLEQEKAHKSQELLSHEKVFRQKFEEERVGLRTVIEEFKIAATRREHFKGLRDNDLVRRFRMILSHVEGFSRMRWDEDREASWPIAKSHMWQLTASNPRKLKEYIVQSSLWSLLHERIFRSPFCVFGYEGRDMDRNWISTYASGNSAKTKLDSRHG
jgi:DNA repair exonuclease SbcCD ATPase subunit